MHGLNKARMIDAHATGAILRKYRRRHGLSMSEVAVLCGCSLSTVSAWESGRSLPNLQAIAVLSGLYGCRIDDLVATYI